MITHLKRATFIFAIGSAGSTFLLLTLLGVSRFVVWDFTTPVNWEAVFIPWRAFQVLSVLVALTVTIATAMED